MKEGKNLKIIIILGILLFLTITIGVFVIENLIKNKVDETNGKETTSESIIETSSEQTETPNESNSEINESDTDENIDESIKESETKNKVEYTKKEKEKIAKDLLENLKPEKSSIIKNVDEDKYYFITQLKNNTKYIITKVELSYKVDAGVYTYLIYNEQLDKNALSKEIQCYAKSGDSLYDLFSENITFIDENGQEQLFTYMFDTKKITFN